MINTELFEALAMLEKEKGIPADYMLEKIEAALLSAVRRDAGEIVNTEVSIDKDKCEIKLVSKLTVVEEVENPQEEILLSEAQEISKKYKIGDTVEKEIMPLDFGRISATTAKQVIVQGIREAERGMIYDEFQNKEGQILTGLVTRIDARSATIEIGKTEVYLLNGEQIPGENLKEGSRVKIYIVEVRNTTRGPQVIVSRTHPNFVKRLFELEIPEISEGIVEIKSIAREAGSRTKIAVSSTDPNVDAVGSCIGQKRSRIANVVAELRNEKIDIIRWDEDPLKFVAASLSPAEATDVVLVEGEKSCQATVPDDQLSLAIGKEGLNVRLAAKLTGWKIDIKADK